MISVSEIMLVIRGERPSSRSQAAAEKGQEEHRRVFMAIASEAGMVLPGLETHGVKVNAREIVTPEKALKAYIGDGICLTARPDILIGSRYIEVKPRLEPQHSIQTMLGSMVVNQRLGESDASLIYTYSSHRFDSVHSMPSGGSPWWGEAVELVGLAARIRDLQDGIDGGKELKKSASHMLPMFAPSKNEIGQVADMSQEAIELRRDFDEICGYVVTGLMGSMTRLDS